jgi:GTP pyrophosphokinase
MVPLTYKLKIGDKIDILTSKEPSPSRDWLNPQQGYLATARARAKVHSWFKKRDYDQNLADGQTIFQRELKRLNLSGIDPTILCKRFHLVNGNDILAAIGCGDIRIPQLTGSLQEQLQQNQAQEPLDLKTVLSKSKRNTKAPKGILVEGVNDLLTQVANCCKPLPGESIIGYITIGRGITIHRQDCKNMLQSQQEHPERLVEASWGDVQKQNYTVDLVLQAHNLKDLLRDLTRLISDESINIYGLNSYADKHNNLTIINLSLEISDMQQLSQIQGRLLGAKDVIAIRRQ